MKTCIIDRKVIVKSNSLDKFNNAMQISRRRGLHVSYHIDWENHQLTQFTVNFNSEKRLSGYTKLLDETIGLAFKFPSV